MVANKPTGTVDGDMMLAFQMSNWDLQSDLTAPAGWTLLTQLDRGSSNLHLKIWTKPASSEGASYTFSPGPSADSILTINSYRGADTNTANWLYATPVWAAAATSRVAPSVSGAPAGSMLTCYALMDGNNNALTSLPPSGMTEASERQSTTYPMQTTAYLASPANPSGTKTFTFSGTFGGTQGGIAWSVVIPQASAPAAKGNFFSMF